MPSLQYGYIKNAYIEIPENHEELSQVIKRILEYKQLSKQMEKYKTAILQQVDKIPIENKIIFKIGDEFKAVSGKGSFNKMKEEGLCSDTYNEEQGYIYPFYDASTKNNHIKGYCKEYNVDKDIIKVVKDANPWLKYGGDSANDLYKPLKIKIKSMYSVYDPLAAGESIFLNNKCFVGDHAFYMYGRYANELNTLLLSKFLKSTSNGTNGLHSVSFERVKNHIFEIPKNHKELSLIIERINKQQEIVNKTVKKMEEYINGVLQLSLK